MYYINIIHEINQVSIHNNQTLDKRDDLAAELSVAYATRMNHQAAIKTANEKADSLKYEVVDYTTI